MLSMKKRRKKRPSSAQLAWSPGKIRDLREALDLTQTEAAFKVGVTRRQWAAWEAGESRPSGPAILLLQLLEDKKI